MGLQVHGAQLPALRRISDARHEPTVLLLLRNVQPVLEQDDAVVDQEVFEDGTAFEKLLVFLLGAEAHDELDASAVVPASVEDDNFSARRKMLDVALRIDLRLLA